MLARDPLSVFREPHAELRFAPSVFPNYCGLLSPPPTFGRKHALPRCGRSDFAGPQIAVVLLLRRAIAAHRDACSSYCFRPDAVLWLHRARRLNGRARHKLRQNSPRLCRVEHAWQSMYFRSRSAAVSAARFRLALDRWRFAVSVSHLLTAPASRARPQALPRGGRYAFRQYRIGPAATARFTHRSAPRGLMCELAIELANLRATGIEVVGELKARAFQASICFTRQLKIFTKPFYFGFEHRRPFQPDKIPCAAFRRRYAPPRAFPTRFSVWDFSCSRARKVLLNGATSLSKASLRSSSSRSCGRCRSAGYVEPRFPRRCASHVGQVFDRDMIAAVAVSVSRSASQRVGSGRGAFSAKKVRQLRHGDASQPQTPTNSPKRRNWRYVIISLRRWKQRQLIPVRYSPSQSRRAPGAQSDLTGARGEPWANYLWMAREVPFNGPTGRRSRGRYGFSAFRMRVSIGPPARNQGMCRTGIFGWCGCRIVRRAYSRIALSRNYGRRARRSKRPSSRSLPAPGKYGRSAHLDQTYSAFLGELHRRLSAMKVSACFEHGSHPLVYWPSLAIFLVVALGLAALIVETLHGGAASGAAIVAIFLALYLWQGGNFLRRNRPGRYRPDTLPRAVMPS